MSNKRSGYPKVHITGERSIRFSFSDLLGIETFNQVQGFCDLLERESRFLIDEIVPSYHTVTVYLKRNLEKKDVFIESLLAKWDQGQQDGAPRKTRKLRIPVCYGEEFAFDLETVIKHTGLTEKEIISLHSNTIYTVYMIGFLPGFPYLGTLNKKLITPRLYTPRATVPKGAVGIGGSQTGIYPIECPGGWNLIGRTPLEIYRPDRAVPFFISAGDQLEFFSISGTEYVAIEEQLEKHPESIKEFIV
jgi:inhibitor of KinA